MSTRYGVTHVNPDWDAIGAAYFAQLIWGEMEWKFVPQNNPPQDVLDGAFVVVDVGRFHNIKLRRFDHHQWSWADQKGICAASLVCVHGMDIDIKRFDPLWPLAYHVIQGDTGVRNDVMKHSALMGMHADLSQMKRLSNNPSDTEVLYWGFAYLERKCEQLYFDYKVRQEVDEHIWHRYGDDIVLLGNSTGALARAANEIYPIVIFINEGDDTNTIGIQRQFGMNMHMGDIVEHILDHHSDEPGFALELGGDGTEENKGWFKHESGFFAGRGTKTAPSTRPIEIDLNSLIEFVGQAYLSLKKHQEDTDGSNT